MVETITLTLSDPEGNVSAPVTVPITWTGVTPPIAGATLAWSEPFTDLSAWNVQDGTTRSNEQSVALASNVTVSGGALILARHKLATPLVKIPRRAGRALEEDLLYRKASDDGHDLVERARLVATTTSYAYSSAYIDSIGKPARSVKAGQYIEWEARFGLSQGTSAGVWPGLVWLRSQLGPVEIDRGEDWGTLSTRSGLSDDPSGRYLCTYWPNTNGSLPKVAGFMAAKGELDLTGWVQMGLRIDLDGSITPYRNGVPYAPTGGAWPKTPTLTAAANPGLKPLAGDYYNLRINVQIGNSYYGSPDASTDWSQTSGVRNLRCWNLPA